MPNITKRALGASLKKLLNRMPLDKITIQNLVDDAEVSRKTFYYHFQDIYDLLEWVLADDMRRTLEGRVTPDTWQEGLHYAFGYLQENRSMILNIHRSLQNNSTLLDQYVSRLIHPLIQEVFEAQPGCERVSEEDRWLILEMYSFGAMKLLSLWIRDGMESDTEHTIDRVRRLVTGSMVSLIQRCLEET